MCPILDGYGVMTVRNSEQKVTITDNKRNKIINQHNTLGLCDEKSSYKHVSDFGRLRSYDRLKLRIEGNDY